MPNNRIKQFLEAIKDAKRKAEKRTVVKDLLREYNDELLLYKGENQQNILQLASKSNQSILRLLQESLILKVNSLLNSITSRITKENFSQIEQLKKYLHLLFDTENIELIEFTSYGENINKLIETIRNKPFLFTILHNELIESIEKVGRSFSGLPQVTLITTEEGVNLTSRGYDLDNKRIIDVPVDSAVSQIKSLLTNHHPETLRSMMVNENGHNKLLLFAKTAPNGFGIRCYDFNDGSWHEDTWGPNGWDDARHFQDSILNTLRVNTVEINGETRIIMNMRDHNVMHVYSYNLDTHEGKWLKYNNSPKFESGKGWSNAHYYSSLQTQIIGGDLFLFYRGEKGIGLHKLNLSTEEWGRVGEEAKASFADNSITGIDMTKEEYYIPFKVHAITNNDNTCLYLISKQANIYSIYSIYNSRDDRFNPIRVGGINENVNPNITQPQYYHTVHTQSLNKDGVNHLCIIGRTPDGVMVYLFNPKNNTHVKATIGPRWAEEGWDKPENYSTIQTKVVEHKGREQLLLMGCLDGKVEMHLYDPQMDNWQLLPCNLELTPRSISGREKIILNAFRKNPILKIMDTAKEAASCLDKNVQLLKTIITFSGFASGINNQNIIQMLDDLSKISKFKELFDESREDRLPMILEVENLVTSYRTKIGGLIERVKEVAGFSVVGSSFARNIARNIALIVKYCKSKLFGILVNPELTNLTEVFLNRTYNDAETFVERLGDKFWDTREFQEDGCKALIKKLLESIDNMPIQNIRFVEGKLNLLFKMLKWESKDYKQLMMDAAEELNLPLVRGCFNLKISTENLDDAGNSLLHLVFGSTDNIDKRIKFLKLLISYGIELNSANTRGNTALHTAITTFNQKERGNKEKLKLKEVALILIDAGVDLFIENDEGYSCYQLIDLQLQQISRSELDRLCLIAARNSNPVAQKILLSSGKILNTDDLWYEPVADIIVLQRNMEEFCNAVNLLPEGGIPEERLIGQRGEVQNQRLRDMVGRIIDKDTRSQYDLTFLPNQEACFQGLEKYRNMPIYKASMLYESGELVKNGNWDPCHTTGLFCAALIDRHQGKNVHSNFIQALQNRIKEGVGINFRFTNFEIDTFFHRDKYRILEDFVKDAGIKLNILHLAIVLDVRDSQVGRNNLLNSLIGGDNKNNLQLLRHQLGTMSHYLYFAAILRSIPRELIDRPFSAFEQLFEFAETEEILEAQQMFHMEGRREVNALQSSEEIQGAVQERMPPLAEQPTPYFLGQFALHTSNRTVMVVEGEVEQPQQRQVRNTLGL